MDNGQDCVAGGQKLILKPRITITCSSIAETNLERSIQWNFL